MSYSNIKNLEEIINKKVLFFDLETTGLVRTQRGEKPEEEYQDYKDLEKYDNARIVSIGWLYLEDYDYDYEIGLENISEKIIKPKGFKIPDESIKIHGITNEKAKKDGKKLRESLKKFGKIIKKCEYIVGYNVYYDINILLSELYRKKNTKTIEKILKLKEEKKIICLGQISAKEAKPEGWKQYIKYQIPKQKDVYKKCLNYELENAHNAKHDVLGMIKIIFWIYENKLLNKEIYKEIKGIEEFKNFEISNLGNVRNKNSKNILQGQIYKKGRLYEYNKKRIYAHELVSKHYLPKPEGEYELIHLDKNTLNNNINNLLWVEKINKKELCCNKKMIYENKIYFCESCNEYTCAKCFGREGYCAEKVIMIASEEQKEIIKAIKENNVIVDSVAGSGKTTTNIFIAKEYPEKKILLLTFNRKLSDETKERLNKENIINLEVYTYHGFSCKNYIETHDDKGMQESLNLRCKNKLEYEIIIIDEAQDINELYYKFICKILFENSKDYNLCILGDKNQCIYEFMGADNRYLTIADKIFNQNKKNWTKLKLSTSYRMTKQMAKFMNKCILNEERIISTKEGRKPEYYILNLYDLNDILGDLLYDKKYKPEDIFILAPSVKGKNTLKNTPLTNIENYLTRNKINIYIPSSDDEKLSEDITKNKLVFSSFHQSKGLERKVVICYGIDSSYYEFYGKEVSQERCPNIIYVALTRAKEKLIILQDVKKNMIPFINTDNMDECVNIIFLKEKKIIKRN